MRHDLYYDLYSKEQDYWWHVGKRAIVYALLETFRRNVHSKGDTFALDLGCGTGLNLDRLAAYATPVGTDFSEEALRFCLARGHFRLCKADAAELPFADSQFAIVTALDVIEHLDDDVIALREIRRVLKPGGLMITSVPAYPLLWTYWDDILGHRRRYTVKSLRTAMLKAGFDVRKVSYSNTVILIPTVAVRIIKSLLQSRSANRGAGTDPESDFMPVPGWLNWLLTRYYFMEAAYLRRGSLPFGLSVVCVCQKAKSSD